MLPNKKMDSFRDDNQGETPQSSEPHVVVACPTCRTKFAVEGSLVASFETPRFHCSRCDAVFELGDKAQASRSLAQRDSNRRWVLAEDTTATTTQDQARTIPSTQPALKTTDFSLGEASSTELNPSPPFAIFPPQSDRPGLSLLGLHKPAAQSTPLSETPLTHSAIPPRKTPSISVEEVSQSIASDPFSLFDDPTVPLGQTNNSVSHPPTPPWSGSAQTQSRSPLGRSATSTASNKHTVTPENIDTSEVPATRSPKIMAGRSKLLTVTFSRLSIRTRSLAYLSVPIVVVLGLLATVGYSAYFAPKTLDAALRTIAPSLMTGSTSQLPPAELSVQDISLEFVKTQSREGLGVVRGVVFNGSHTSLNDVRLEALGFDDRGQIVVRAQAPLRSALAREKVSDLSLATVRKFQESLSASSSRIAAGERVAFTIALLGSDEGTNSSSSSPIDLSQVRYFSARVFSVGQ